VGGVYCHRMKTTSFRTTTFAAILLSAFALTVSVAPAMADTADKTHKHQILLLQDSQKPAKNVVHLRDNHRTFNPMTGNFEEAGPFGPRGNK